MIILWKDINNLEPFILWKIILLASKETEILQTNHFSLNVVMSALLIIGWHGYWKTPWVALSPGGEGL